jgi:hypothetical protein
VGDLVVNTPNDGNCANGAFCDGDETCDALLDCQAGTPVSVDDGVTCTDDSCDEVADVVVNTPNDGNCATGLPALGPWGVGVLILAMLLGALAAPAMSRS